MRRTYISPEFDYVPVNGTLNMLEQSSFFGSKMLEIADSIQIKNENVIYYQQPNNEQINSTIEATLPQVVYDTVSDKSKSHRLFLDESQTETQKNGNTRWILDIEIKTILKNYVFANLKKFRTFEGVLNDSTIDKNVNSSILNYIDNNVLSRYKFVKVEFFYKTTDLLTIGTLKYKNEFDVNIELVPNSIFTRFQTETDSRDEDIRLTFYQDKSSSQYSFKYYFNLYFEKL